VFVINFLALGLIWAYVMRSYPTCEAAQFWTGRIRRAAGGALATLRSSWIRLCPLLPAHRADFAACLARWASGGFMTNRMVARHALITD